MDNKELKSKDENELDIITECTINDRTFVITADKKIYEKDRNNKYKEYSEDNEETAFLKKYTEPPKSLDIELEDNDR